MLKFPSRLLFALLMLVSVGGFATVFPELSGPVIDQAAVIGADTESEITATLVDLNQKHQIQIQVLTVKDLGGIPIEQYSIGVVEKWKLGNATTDKGVLFLVALNERQMRIEVGQGLEGDLPDAYAKRIIEDWVKPFFKAGDFSSGVKSGVFRIIDYVAPEFAQNLQSQNPRRGREQFESRGGGVRGLEVILFIAIFLLTLFFQVRGGRRGFRGGGGWSGGGSGGWSGGGSGGGGWSGGGGGFSGGGASGGW